MSSSHVPSSGQDGARAPRPPTDPPRPADAAQPSPEPRPTTPDPGPTREARAAPAGPGVTTRRTGATRTRIRSRMASRTALRDAFLLHEILGPPVSLRDPREDASPR